MVTFTSKRSESAFELIDGRSFRSCPVSKKAKVQNLVGGRQGDRTGVLDYWSDLYIVLIINSIY